jgi:hypothetical protein
LISHINGKALDEVIKDIVLSKIFGPKREKENGV